MKIKKVEIKCVMITHLFKTTVENLTKIEAITDHPCLFWCNGYLINSTEYSTEKITDKILDGTLYIQDFSYAECKEKISVAKWNGYSIEVPDVTGYEIFEAITEKLKEGSLV